MRQVVRRSKGSSIAETAAAMAVMIPLIFAVLFVVLEASQAYMIKEALAQAARQAARDLAIYYGQNQNVQYDRNLQETMVFDNIRISGIVVSSEQFSDPEWKTATSTPTVKVTVTYTSGQNGLPTFPNPDPLKLSGKFLLNATSTYRLE